MALRKAWRKNGRTHRPPLPLLPDHHHLPQTSAHPTHGALQTFPPINGEAEEKVRVRNGLLSCCIYEEPYLYIGSQARPQSWDPIKQDFSFPPTSHCQKLPQHKLGWGATGATGPQGPNVSLHADTYLGSQWFLGGQGKELKVQLAAMGLNVNAATITRALGGIMSFSETQFPYLQKE